MPATQRRIDLDQRAVATLRAWRATQTQERLLVGTGSHDSGLVFTLPDGRPYNPEYVAREFTPRLQRHGLPRIRGQDLRHTWATLAQFRRRRGRQDRLRAAGARLQSHHTRHLQHVSPAMASDTAEKAAGIIFGEPT